MRLSPQGSVDSLTVPNHKNVGNVDARSLLLWLTQFNGTLRTLTCTASATDAERRPDGKVLEVIPQRVGFSRCPKSA
ncbi:hypothetical protein O9992_05140 [Vibrio lentus]|nr:hypothetical protein [Vibrio lentus]